MQAAEKLPVAADERVQRALERVGQVVRDRWHLDAVLGVGGTAAVYAATHRNGKRVALKLLHPELSTSPEMRQRFIDEGYLANRLGHPGAVSVIDDDVTEHGHVFLIMDLLEGETLDQLVSDGGWLLPARVLTIADAVLDILAAAHDQGIVHRDVKPDNIFLTRDGQIRLLDFGIARATTPGRTHTTQNGTALGTPAFMPPEQARGRWEQIDGRTDIWSVGATMFYLLTGRDVHEAETVNEELLSAMTKRAPSLGELAAHLPKPLIDLVDRALAFERTDRWPSARDMQAAVRRVEALLGSESTPPSSSSKENSVGPASPTLVTPVLERVPPRASLRARAARAALVITVSAVASFAGLVAVRKLGQTVRAGAPPAPIAAIQEPAADLATPSPEEWLARQAAFGSPAKPASSGEAPNEPASLPAKMRADRPRPKPLSRSVDEPRSWVASGIQSSTTAPVERFVAVPASQDPLDRRK
jgi:serine/threonine-protein kinase